MKNLVSALCVLLLGSMMLQPTMVDASSTKKKPVTTQAKKSGSQAKKAKPPVRKAAASSSSGQRCRVQKLANGKTRRVCSAASREQSLKSPIKANALSPTVEAARAPEVKVRSAPDRAYAVSGESFFFQGRKYRIAGMSAAGGEMARQRLQQSLESGKLLIDPHSTDETGVTTARVRVNGQDLAEQAY